MVDRAELLARYEAKFDEYVTQNPIDLDKMEIDATANSSVGQAAEMHASNLLSAFSKKILSLESISVPDIIIGFLDEKEEASKIWLKPLDGTLIKRYSKPIALYQGREMFKEKFLDQATGQESEFAKARWRDVSPHRPTASNSASAGKMPSLALACP